MAEKINIKLHGHDTNRLTKLQTLLKPNQLDNIPKVSIDDVDVDDINIDYLADVKQHHNTPNDNCIALGLYVYDDHATAGVALNDDWRMYPSDDNLQKLRQIFDTDHIRLEFT